MRIRTEFPRPTRVIDTAWIELADGCRLAARVWLPIDAESDPVPAIVEYIPYRKHDGTRAATPRCIRTSQAMATPASASTCGAPATPTACLHDEYLKQEQDDALEVIAWLAAQPWCSGEVGMIGISWGGFNGLQIAARRRRS